MNLSVYSHADGSRFSKSFSSRLQLERATQELEKAKDDALAEIQRVTSERDRARVDGISVRMDQMVKTDTQGTWM